MVCPVFFETDVTYLELTCFFIDLFVFFLGVDNAFRKDIDMDENESAVQPTRRMSHLDALAEKLNSENDKTGFFQMVNRSSRLNASSYSLSSLYSVGSINCGSTVSGFTTTGSRHESARNRRSSLWQGPSAIKALYSLLLEPMEDEFPEEGSEIMLVLESNLFMVRIRFFFKFTIVLPKLDQDDML